MTKSKKFSLTFWFGLQYMCVPIAFFMTLAVCAGFWYYIPEKGGLTAILILFLVLSPAAFFSIVSYASGIRKGYFLGQIDVWNEVASRLPTRSETRDEVPTAEDAAVLVSSLSNDGNVWRGSRMDLAIKVQERYWHPDRFDAGDPDTVPKQREIVEWIRQTSPEISEIQAKSIEKVACPVDR
jgi:hypothetical protein